VALVIRSLNKQVYRYASTPPWFFIRAAFTSVLLGNFFRVKNFCRGTSFSKYKASGRLFPFNFWSAGSLIASFARWSVEKQVNRFFGYNWRNGPRDPRKAGLMDVFCPLRRKKHPLALHCFSSISRVGTLFKRGRGTSSVNGPENLDLYVTQ